MLEIMNEPSPSLWEKLVVEPRRFFLWLAAAALAVLVLLVVAEVMSPGINPSPFLRTLAAWTLLTAVLAFAVGFFGFFLALIPPLKPLFRWMVRRVAFLTASLVTLVALFYAQENWRGKRAWEDFKREAAARHEPVEIKDIIPPPVPEDQNVVATPLFKPVADEFDPEWRRLHTGPNGLTNEADRLKFNFTRMGDSGPTNDAAASWAVARRTDLKEWQKYFRDPFYGKESEAALDRTSKQYAEVFRKRYGIAPESTTLSESNAQGEVVNEFATAPQPQSPAVDVLLALSKHAALTEELRVACQRPHARFPIRYDDGFSALLPHLARMKTINQFLALRAAAELHAGKAEAAAADTLLGMRVVDLARSEPLLISQLVRLAQVQIALNPFWEGLAEHRWTDAQLVAFEDQLGRFDFLKDYRHGMRGERALCTGVIDFVRRERLLDVLDVSPQQSNAGPLERMFGAGLFHLVPRGWFDQNKASVGRMHLDLILPAVNPEARQVTPAKVQEAVSGLERELRQFSPYNFFARLLLPALNKASERAAQGQAAVDLARVAGALERHRLAHGQYPESLDALAPRFIAQLPHDLINGSPLKYRRADDGTFLLYSVGWNETDDGGTTVRYKDQHGLNWQEGDWVWRYSAD